jgi:sarcosine oxidase / L-pipecolate oxidase
MASVWDDSYLIVGAGIFGASTAWSLIRKYPKASIRIVDREPFPCQLAASWDWNKIIRAEYNDIFYMKLALEAKDLWEKDPLYAPFYHAANGVWIQDTNMADIISDNYAKLGLPDQVTRYTVEDAKKIYDGLFDQAEYEGIDQVLVSTGTGWAEATKALTAVLQAATKAGAIHVNGNITSLVFNDAGDCTGVRTAAGETLTASKIILSTGAGTAKLLADSAPHWKDLHAGERFIAAAMCTALMTPEADACAHFKDVPIVLHERLHYPGRGGFIPPTPDGNFKWWADITFSNLTKHESGEDISSPPGGPYQGQWDVPELFHKEMATGRDVIFGEKAKHFGFDKYRFCWDAISRDDNFFIGPHPASKNLYLATVGSFHSYKFLPTIGKYVVKMLEGTLEEEHAQRWAWDRKVESEGAHGYWPKRDWKDLVK